jgi:hypothetical protein
VSALLLEELLRLVDLLLLWLGSDERLAGGQSAVELAVAIVLKQFQVRAHLRRVRLIALRW